MIKNTSLKLFLEKEFNYPTKIKYSKRLKDYHSFLKITKDRKLIFVLSPKWKEVDKEIKIGLIQTLLSRFFKIKRETKEMGFYHNFVRNLASFVPKNRFEPVLEESFERVNQEYFNGLLEKPNLVFHCPSLKKIASYNFYTNTISVSPLFKDDPEILDFLVFHELLHKKLKFVNKNNYYLFHTHKFKNEENLFKNKEIIEKRIQQRLQKLFKIN